MFNILLTEADVSMLDSIPAGWWKWIIIGLAIIKFADIVVKLTPNKTDDKILKFIKPIANLLSLNVPDVDEVKKKGGEKK